MGSKTHYGITIPDPEPTGAGGALLIDALKEVAERGVFNPVAQTDPSPYTATNGDLVVVTLSGGSGTVNLPASPDAGDRVGVKLWSTTSNYIITVSGNGNTIEGTAAKEDTLYLDGDYIEYQYDGTRWLAYPTCKPHFAQLIREQDSTYWTQSTFTMHHLDVVKANDPEGMTATTHRIDILRPGLYSIDWQFWWTRLNFGQYVRALIYKNGTYLSASNMATQLIERAQDNDEFVWCNWRGVARLAAGDYLHGYLYHNSNDAERMTRYSNANYFPQLTVTEIRG
jgi:hypothetical protein